MKRRLSIRARLTLVYGGLFLVAGVVLLGVTYLLAATSLFEDPLPGPGPAPPADMPAVVRAARAEALETLLAQGGIALGLVGLTATGLGWLVAGRMLRPLHLITDTARRIAHAPDADRRLGERIGLGGPPDELRELADTFDLMLERLDHSFDGQRRFIANASHELRTPLTVNRTLIEVSFEPDTVPPEFRRLGDALLAVNTRHEQLIDGLLVLASADRPLSRTAYVDLADVAEHVVAGTDAGKAEVHTDLAEAPTTGDPVLLERLVRNLLDNGVRYNVPERGWVRLHTGTRPDGAAVLRVENTGPPVSRHEAVRLFEPFHRGDRFTTPGTGLGLSIARSVAVAHGGTIHADPREDGGLTVTVALPAPA